MRIGTRGSTLALAQAQWVADRIGAEAEVVTITTAGDLGDHVDDKSRWVSALERALLDDRVDVAVHSAKDVPAELAPGLAIVAVPPREDPRDVICGVPSLADLPTGARIGTSSLRRAAQIRATRPDLQVLELHGNVDTRLRKLAEGQFDAIVLAMAGLRRLGREAEAGGVLDDFVPAAGQGALALQARERSATAEALGPLNSEAADCLAAEREFTRILGASCHSAVGAHARIVDDRSIELTAWVGLPDGSQWIADQATDSAPGPLGATVAERMLAAGAGELLAP